MAEKVASRGGRAIIAGGGEGADIPCSWHDPQNAKSVLTHLQKSGDRIDGVIHLVPLERYPDAGPMDHLRIDEGLKSFFILIQGLFDQLNRPGTFIAMPSMHATIFPYRENGGAIDPLMAGLAGMLKTVNKELADTRVKVVDFAAADPLAGIEERAETFLDEVLSGDPRVECGYANGKKYVLQLVPRAPAENARFIHEGDTLLVTGGARGITFEILKALVASVKIKLVILGRSNLDDLDPALADPAIDKATIMAKLKTIMPDAKPITIKQALDRTLGTRASIANLDALRALGATVAYHPVDVTDAEAVAAAVATAGPLDGVLHAAGLEESQVIPKKTMASFDRVFDTKVTGLLNVLAALGTIRRAT